jgi:beta-lactamase class A
METALDRRALLGLVAGLLATGTRAAAPPPLDLAAAALAAEAATGGRLGLAVIDTATGRRFSHRGAELFPMASTFKLLLAAAVLAQVDAGRERLDRQVAVKPGDIAGHSPFSQSRVGSTATIAELAGAAVTQSDNGATNLLLATIGGPAGMTAFMRALDDKVTRLDRYETMMSEGRPGDPRDTTSPDAAAQSWQKLLFGPTLSPASRAQLIAWLIANTTGDTRLRAGLPPGWRVGDKTGSGGNNSVNDIAIVWPPGAASPVIIAAFLNGGKGTTEAHAAVLASLARAVAASLAAATPPAR